MTQTGAEINGNVITLHFVDGLRGDDDLTANGVIVDVGGPDYNVQTVVTLSSFLAVPKAGKVLVTWTTESEIDNAGFNIYRAESVNSKFTKINKALIPAKGSATQKAAYDFMDNAVQNRKTYYYRLEDIDINGTSTFHGPISARPRLLYGQQ
jgi:hypothetical protein